MTAQAEHDTPEAKEARHRIIFEAAAAHSFLDGCGIPRLADEKEDGRLVPLTLKQRVVALDSRWANNVGEPDAPEAKQILSPGEVAHGAVDRLCDYDAWNAPGSYQSTADRIGEFMSEFIGIAAARLAGAVQDGGAKQGEPDA